MQREVNRSAPTTTVRQYWSALNHHPVLISAGRKVEPQSDPNGAARLELDLVGRRRDVR